MDILELELQRTERNIVSYYRYDDWIERDTFSIVEVDYESKIFGSFIANIESLAVVIEKLED